MNTLALTAENYHFVDSARITGKPMATVHIDNSAYFQVELALDQFLGLRANIDNSAYFQVELALDQFLGLRANIDYLRNFECVVPMKGKRELVVKIDSMYVYWRKCEAEDGEWYEPTEIHPMWSEAYLYDEDGEKIPHDFDINIVLRRLTTH